MDAAAWVAEIRKGGTSKPAAWFNVPAPRAGKVLRFGIEPRANLDLEPLALDGIVAHPVNALFLINTNEQAITGLPERKERIASSRRQGLGQAKRTAFMQPKVRPCPAFSLLGIFVHAFQTRVIEKRAFAGAGIPVSVL
jgi:hypothetical protein